MKRLVIFLIITGLIVSAVSAQAIQDQRAAPQTKQNAPAPRGARTNEVNTVTVEGTLKLEKGFVAVEKDADNVYIVPMLNRYIGFINGLREGAKVSVEGYEFRNAIRPTKVTIEGKSYDFMTMNSQAPEFGKRDFRPGNDRFAPTPYGNNRRNDRRNSRRRCCR